MQARGQIRAACGDPVSSDSAGQPDDRVRAPAVLAGSGQVLKRRGLEVVADLRDAQRRQRLSDRGFVDGQVDVRVGRRGQPPGHALPTAGPVGGYQPRRPGTQEHHAHGYRDQGGHDVADAGQGRPVPVPGHAQRPGHRDDHAGQEQQTGEERHQGHDRDDGGAQSYG